MGRYSTVSVAQMDPLSLDEILAAPLYKQKQYDQLETDRAKQADMFKIDPSDVHSERASQINKDYMSKVDELANYQTKTGDIQGSKSKLLDLQREYKRLNDPMGDVSKINVAKTALQNEQTRFLEAASKQYGSARALELWNKHKSEYKGYDDKGNVTNITPQGIVANQDFMKDVKEYKDLMGKTASSIAGSGYRIVERPEGLVMVNSSGKTVSNNNFEQLKNAEQALKSKWIDPTGEGTLYNLEAGKDPEEFRNQFKNTMLSQRESSVLKDSDTSASFIGPKTTSNSVADPSTSSSIYGTSTVGGNEKSISFIDSIGSKLSSIPIDPKDSEGNKQKIREYNSRAGNAVKYTDLPENERAIYKATYDKLIRENRIKKAFQDPNNIDTAKFIKQELIKNPITLSDRKVETDVTLNNLGFPSEIDTKTAKSRDESIQKGIISGSRTILDPETNKVISFNEFTDKYAKDGDFDKMNVKFDSQLSPMNHKYLNFRNEKAASSPDIITFKDKDNKTQQTYVSKEYDYQNSNNGKADDLITKTYRTMSVDANTFVPIDHPNLKGTSIKYIPEQDAVILKNSTGQESSPITLDVFNKIIYSTKL